MGQFSMEKPRLPGSALSGNQHLEGKHYSDVAGAVAEAEEAAREMLADRVKRGMELDGQRIEITDADGTILHVVKYADLVRWPQAKALL
jgi:hypothetical protein